MYDFKPLDTQRTCVLGLVAQCEDLPGQSTRDFLADFTDGNHWSLKHLIDSHAKSSLLWIKNLYLGGNHPLKWRRNWNRRLFDWLRTTPLCRTKWIAGRGSGSWVKRHWVLTMTGTRSNYPCLPKCWKLFKTIVSRNMNSNSLTD